MEYQILTSNNITPLENAVNEALEHGWKLQGGITWAAIEGWDGLAQAMVRDVPRTAAATGEEREAKYCGSCRYFTGEECGGFTHEGNEVYEDTPACGDFEEQEATDE